MAGVSFGVGGVEGETKLLASLCSLRRRSLVLFGLVRCSGVPLLSDGSGAQETGNDVANFVRLSNFPDY